MRLLLPFLFLLNTLSAQTVFLDVHVTDSLTREPLAGATLRMTALSKGAITDSDGVGRFGDLHAGTWQVDVSYLGYQPQSIFVVLQGSKKIVVGLLPEGGDLQEVIVQSTRTGNRVEDSPTKVEVLGRDDMDEENNLKPNNVASILGDYSGIQIQQTGLASGNATIRIQGLAGRYTQILRDGLPLYAGLSGDFGILQIQPLDLQQIELIKGPASTFFGGGAIAGVVNFISKTPGAKPERALTINQTTLGETNTTMWFSGKNKRWGYTFFGGASRGTPKDVDGDAFTDVPRLRTATLHPRVFYYPKNGGQLAIGLTWTGENRRGGDLLAVQNQQVVNHTYVEKNATSRAVADLQYQRATKHGGMWTAKAALSQFSRQRVLPDWTFDGKQQNWFSELAYRQVLNPHVQWVAGVNYSGDAFRKLKTEGLLFQDFQNHTGGVFGQGAFHVGKLDAEAGVRLDARTTWGLFALPSVALLYHLTQDVSLRAGVGLGYVAPNLLSSGDADTDLRRLLPFPAGLQAERSMGGNLEWNYHHLFGDHFSATWNQQFFYTRLNQPVIQTDTFGGELFSLNTEKPVTTAGVDHYLRLLYDEVELYLGYTYQHARQTWNTAQPAVPITPTHRAAAVISLPLGKHFRTGLESAWTGRQTLEDGAKTIPYWFVAGMVGYKIGHFNIVLNGENLLDFRQTRHEQVVLPPLNNPVFRTLWAPVDGRVVNLAVAWRG